MNCMKKWLAAAALMLCGQASASIVETVYLEFESGATWEGTITFNDGYLGMTDAEGWLTGGSNNFNEFFSWTWWQGTGQTNPQDWNGDGFFTDWLMNGTSSSDYTIYIGLAWSVVDTQLTFALLSDPYYSGNNVYNDLITNVSTTGVTEPSALLLAGLGLGLLLMQRRRH
ncbi:MAG: hypothetical protein ACOY3E_07820 [Pseudomonadota bacterium]